MTSKDARMGSTSEAVAGMELLKMNTWETAFFKRISASREGEMRKKQTWVDYTKMDSKLGYINCI